MKHGLEKVDASFRAVVESLLLGLKELLGENLVSLVLFGSVARGDWKEGSDIDILVAARNLPSSFSKRIDLLIPVLEKARMKSPSRPFIQVYPLNVEEAAKNRPIYLDMLTDAVILYDKDGFMTGVLKGLHDKLATFGAKKIILEDGSWVWILKPGLKAGEVIEL